MMASSPMMLPGRPWPLGASLTAEGVNFALFSGSAEAVTLCLYEADGETEAARIPLAHTDQVWHGCVPGVGIGQRYGYRVYGPYDPMRGLRFNPMKLLLDPYAKAWDRPLRWADEAPGLDLMDNGPAMVKAVVVGPDDFDWGEDHPPAIPLDRLVLYELHVKGFTQLHPDVPEELRGRYAGLVEPGPLQHLKRLGVTAVELLPVMAFIDEPLARQRGLSNYWGYNTLSFFVPEHRYAVADPRREFKEMVKALHAAGIEVILDVVFNHTAEGDDFGPTLSFRGIDNPGYYRLLAGDGSRYDNPTGTGNALDFSRPRVVQLAMDALRWWVTEYRVDGFRFDLTTVLARGRSGAFDPAAPFLVAVAQDPVLRHIKLIAEPWDVGPGGWQVGAFPPGWSEWNDRSRNDLRRFMLRRDLGTGALAQRLAGSSDLFCHDGRNPLASINFVTAHDGFTLADLVTYQAKRNLANGEDNRDGDGGGFGWNAGIEGPSDDPAVNDRRASLKRGLLAVLLACRGVPMLSMGDEVGHSQDGNNNAWCQDNATSWLDWHGADWALAALVARLIAFRCDHAALRGADWLDAQHVDWLASDGTAMAGGRWDDPAVRQLGMRLRPSSEEQEVLVLINGGLDAVSFTLPEGGWSVSVDSAESVAGPVGVQVELAPSSVQYLVRHPS